jgi:hypothetical protein
MIDFLSVLGPDGRPIVRQRLTHPAVYLDTWALRLFAEDDPHGLRARFREALVRAGGTLMLSSLNVGEFTFADRRHAEAAGVFLDTLYPHYFFSNFSPFEVINRELAAAVKQTKEPSAGDSGLLLVFAEDTVNIGQPSLASWFLSNHAVRDQMKQDLASMGAALLAGFDGLRQQFDDDPSFAAVALRNIKESTLPRATQGLLRSLFYRLQADPALKLSVSDAMDIGHSVVAGAYCDFVLIDRVWRARMTDAHEFLQECGITTRVAEFYARHNNGVERFLERLKAWLSGLAEGVPESRNS